MKNENGQVLVLFILILPLILIGSACIVDSSYMIFQKNRLDDINRDVLNSIHTKEFVNEEDVRKLVKANDEAIVIDKITISNDDIKIENHISIHSIFGKLIGIDKYEVSSKTGVKINSLEKLVLDLNELSLYDDTGNYAIVNNNVTYDGDLVFNNSYLRIDNFSLKDKYRIELSFIPSGDGYIFVFNDLTITIINNNLYINNNLISEVNLLEKNSLILTRDIVNFNAIEYPLTYNVNTSMGSLIIGNNYVGKIDYLRIYNSGK